MCCPSSWPVSQSPPGQLAPLWTVCRLILTDTHTHTLAFFSTTLDFLQQVLMFLNQPLVVVEGWKSCSTCFTSLMCTQNNGPTYLTMYTQAHTPFFKPTHLQSHWLLYIKGKFHIVKKRNCHCLLTPIVLEGQVKFCSPLNIVSISQSAPSLFANSFINKCLVSSQHYRSALLNC